MTLIHFMLETKNKATEVRKKYIYSFECVFYM